MVRSTLLLLTVAAALTLIGHWFYRSVQAQSARVAIMQGLSDALMASNAAAKQCDMSKVDAALAALRRGSANVPRAFATLMEAQEFRALQQNLSKALEAPASQSQDCKALSQRVEHIQRACESCHNSLRGNFQTPILR
jgi:cytochrome c556